MYEAPKILDLFDFMSGGAVVVVLLYSTETGLSPSSRLINYHPVHYPPGPRLT
jgi:hypothetical protein